MIVVELDFSDFDRASTRASAMIAKIGRGAYRTIRRQAKALRRVERAICAVHAAPIDERVIRDDASAEAGR